MPLLCFLFWVVMKSEEARNKKESAIYSLRFEGQYNLENGKTEEAEKAFQKLHELIPDDPSVYANLALVLSPTKQFQQSKKKIDKALKKYPDDPGFGIILARYYELTQQPDKAIAQLEKIMNKNPDNAMAGV